LAEASRDSIPEYRSQERVPVKKGDASLVEINGDGIANSNIIIEALAKKFNKEMPAQLSQDQKNVQHAMNAMFENHLYWTIIYWRSKDVDT